MMNYIPRKIEAKISNYLKLFPVLGITGPRQSGKSTTITSVLPEYRYVTFDDARQRSFFYDDPEGFMKEYNNNVIFDEVQKIPEIFELIKISVDKDRNNYGKFILTGSSQFSLIKKITESLAGRIGLISMLPMQYSELPENCKEESIFRGGYPELVSRKYVGFDEWYSSYLSSYLEKDVRDLVNIGDLRDFQRLIELLAANVSQCLNMSNYAKDLGVTVQTVKRWISVLEASYIIFLLPPYFKNYGKRIIKSPKLYFYDSGLVSYLTGISNKDLFKNGPMKGSLYENYIVSEVIKKDNINDKHNVVYFFRTSSHEEIDLIIDRKVNKELIEIKHTSSFKPKMMETISKYLEDDDVGYLLYNGDEFPYKSNIKIINYSQYLSEDR